MTVDEMEDLLELLGEWVEQHLDHHLRPWAEQLTGALVDEIDEREATG